MTRTIQSAFCTVQKALFVLSGLLVGHSLSGQYQFNLATELPLHHVHADGIEKSRSGYVFVAGSIIDTLYERWGYGIGALDEMGMSVCFKEFVSLSGVQRLLFSPILKINDSTFVKAGTSWNPDGVHLVAFNHRCDTLFSRVYTTIFGDSINTHSVQGLKGTRDGGYVIATGISGLSHPEIRRDIAVYKLNSNFELQWTGVFGKGHRTQQGVDIIETPSGGYLIFGVDYYDNDPDYESIRRPLYFIEIDSLGNLVKEKMNGHELRSTNFEVVQTVDGGFILCSSELYEQSSGLLVDNSIFKLNKELNYEWETKAGTIKKSFSSHYRSIIPAPDGIGVIAAGTAVDSVNDLQFHYGIITKLNWDGDSIWSRYYRLDDDNYPIDIAGADLYRIRSSSDNGLIAIGGVYYFPAAPLEPFKQQIWILKMDEFGCVVPGCHLPSSTIDNESDESEYVVSTFPNPFNEELNVFVRTPYENDLFELRVFDFSGNQVFAEQCQLHEVSFRFNTQHWPSGGYLLSAWKDGLPVKTIKTMKQ